MSIEIHEITSEQVQAILDLREGHFQDLKSIDISPASLTKTMSAFANATGGEVYIGIEEQKSNGQIIRLWRGFDNPEAANGHIQIFEELFPLGGNNKYIFLEADGHAGIVLKVEIDKSRAIEQASNGQVYIRRGAQNLPLDTTEKIRRLELDKGITSFEDETVDIPLDLITNSTPIIQFILDVIPTVEPETWIRRQILVRNDRPTVASVLLYAEEPQAILPKRCGIKIYRYETRGDEGTRTTLSFTPISIDGCIYEQIYLAVAKTVEIIEGIQILGTTGLEQIQYPHETLHEIITNAALHRDYSFTTDIQIRIFDNRIEIESPGRLPGHITENNILSEQFARNGRIVRLINKFRNPPNKDVGEGLNTAFEAMRQLRLKEPEISDLENSVLVTIRHEPLASPEEAIMQYLETHDEIKNAIARNITGITSENTMKNVFYRLRDRDLIERVPGKLGSASSWKKK